MSRFWKSVLATIILAGLGLAFIPGLYAQVGTITRRLIGYQDISWATGGTGAAETFAYVDPSGNTLTLTKPDASHLKFRTSLWGAARSVDSIVPRIGYEIWVGDPLYPTFAAAVATLNSAGTSCTLRLPTGTHAVAADLVVNSNILLKPDKGALITVATTKTLTINGPLDAGIYQVFSLTGTGAVAGLKTVYPEWFGAVGNGSADDSAALTASVAACVTDGSIRLSKGTYKTTGLLVQKSLSFIAESPISYGTSTGATLKAAGAQAYVLKFLGVFAGTAFIQPYLQNVNIDGGDYAISDAALVMQYCNFSYLDRLGVQNVNGHGIRLRTCWETRINSPWINNCGTVDTGSAFYIDGPSPFDYAYATNNLRIYGGTWSSNRGRWIDANVLANLEGCWIEANKFELDSTTTPNTVNTSVIYLGAASRTMIINNYFAGFGVTSDKYANLIYMNGDSTPGVGKGNPNNRVWGNRAVAYNPTSGAINGLYLDTDAPTCEEGDNTFLGSNSETCPNVNVSQFPQLINQTWRNQSTSFFPINPLPDREQPGFISIHKISRGNYAIPFEADAAVNNNSQTALKSATIDAAVPKICAKYDLRRFMGHADANLVVRVRMRLSAAESHLVYVNPTAAVGGAGTWSGVPTIVNSTTYTWYEFVFPVSSFTATDHYMDVYHWSKNGGTGYLLVDGIEFSTSNDVIETVTGSPALKVGGISYINSAGGAVTATLADGAFIGQMKTITMTDATASSTVSVTHHPTSDPEVFTFATVGATLVLRWNGTDWETVHNYGATT
jgi:hypothetical protein